MAEEGLCHEGCVCCALLGPKVHKLCVLVTISSKPTQLGSQIDCAQTQHALIASAADKLKQTENKHRTQSHLAGVHCKLAICAASIWLTQSPGLAGGHAYDRKAYRQKEQLEGDDVPLVSEAGSNLPELAAGLKGLLDALLHIAVDLVPEGRLQEQLPAPVITAWSACGTRKIQILGIMKVMLLCLA